MSTTTTTAEHTLALLPDTLPPDLQPPNWLELEPNDACRVWKHYEQFLFNDGYYILGSHLYNTLGAGVTEIRPPAADPFHPKDHETFIHHHRVQELRYTRTCSSFQPSVGVYFGIDKFQRQVVFKALMHDSNGLKILRTLTIHTFRKNKRNRVIPVLDFLETKDFVIVVMACWGWFMLSPPCGNMSIRCAMAIKITEGLAWLHEQRVAHGDIHPGNIVVNHDNARLGWPASPQNDFRSTYNLEYAFIDFGAARIFPCDDHPPFASLESIPPDEFSSPEQKEQLPKEGAIDLFAADVYNLGKTLRAELMNALEEYGEDPLPTQKYQQYKSLLSTMTDPEPENRPTAANVLSSLISLNQE